MKKDLLNPRGALQGQPGSADKVKLREDPTSVHAHTGQETRRGSISPDDQDKHEYPKDEQRWPENKVPTK